MGRRAEAAQAEDCGAARQRPDAPPGAPRTPRFYTMRRPTHDLPILLNAAETAELLRTTRAAVYVMISRGQIPGITRVGRRVLVRSDDLLHWLDQKRAPSP
jgi:excisionase family DNA binding protein